MLMKLDYGCLKQFKIKVYCAICDTGAKMHCSGQSCIFIPFAQEQEVVRKKHTCEYSQGA